MALFHLRNKKGGRLQPRALSTDDFRRKKEQKERPCSGSHHFFTSISKNICLPSLLRNFLGLHFCTCLPTKALTCQYLANCPKSATLCISLFAEKFLPRVACAARAFASNPCVMREFSAKRRLRSVNFKSPSDARRLLCPSRSEIRGTRCFLAISPPLLNS